MLLPSELVRVEDELTMPMAVFLEAKMLLSGLLQLLINTLLANQFKL